MVWTDSRPSIHHPPRVLTELSSPTRWARPFQESVLEAVQGSARGGLPGLPLNFAPSLALFLGFLLIQKKPQRQLAAPSLHWPGPSLRFGRECALAILGGSNHMPRAVPPEAPGLPAVQGPPGVGAGELRSWALHLGHKGTRNGPAPPSLGSSPSLSFLTCDLE